MPLTNDPNFGKTPVWWKVWAGVCIMGAMIGCGLGAWVVVTVVSWLTSK